VKNKLILVDGNAFCYRAFYAIRSLSNSKGEPTNAIYGFVAMLNKLIDQHKPQYLAVAFDLKGATFRHKKFADYKIQRKPMPDELSLQIPTIKEVLSAYRIPIFEKEGYEADDIIATLTKRLAAQGPEILIATGDKDILQIVSDRVKILNPHKDNLVLDEAWVRKRFGLPPKKIVEIMALAGDTSDNIPGVPGIGEATAIGLIKKFGTLEAVLANANKVTNKSRSAKITEFAQQARLSKELATLNCDVPEVAKKDTSKLLECLKLVEADKERLFAIFKKLEFKSLMQKVMSKSKHSVDYKIICGVSGVEEVVRKILAKKAVAVHFWASHREPMRAEILGASFGFEEGPSYFLSLEQASINKLKPILENKDIKKIGHGLKYSKVLLSNYAINLQGISFDTMVASYLLQPESPGFSLGDLALEYLNYDLEGIAAAASEKEAARIYSQNVNTILKLKKILKERLRQNSLSDLFENIELPLIEVLADMEKEGVALDKKFLLHLSSDFEKKLKKLTKEIYEMAGEDFNINSPKQLSVILFEKLKLPVIKRTKTGSSTDTEVLRKLSLKHPVASALLEFREISKLKSTYIDGLTKLIHPKTGRIHTSFNQAGTSTGRLSSTRPNLQNIPIKTELGRKVRRGFVAQRKAIVLLSADYSQIELRILAHLSGDKDLTRAFKEELDIHAHTASLIFGAAADKVTTQMRGVAKTVNFGIIYGMSAYGLSRDLGIEQNRAAEFIEAYFKRYPGVKSYIARQIKKARDEGFVTTLLKRRRYISQINSPNETVRQFAQRAAINAPVQGSAADLIKAAMIEIARGLKAQGLATKMLLQVHDELVFAVPEKELQAARTLVKDKMENVIKLKVPIKVSIKVGKNWLEMK